MEYLNPSDLAKLFRSMHGMNKTHALIALTQFYTGARIQQVLNLRGEDIAEVNGRMSVKIHAMKRGLERWHPLHFDTDPAFDMSPLIELARRRPLARLFGGTSRQYYNLCLKTKYCPAAGLHSDFGHSHVIRHSVAVFLMQKTQRIGAVSHFLQHRSPAAAFSYLAENDGHYGQEAIDALNLAAE